MSFMKFSELVQGNIMKRGISAHVESAMVLEFFNAYIGDSFGSKAGEVSRPLYVKDNVLTIAVLMPTLADELKSRESQIVTTINQKMGHNVITSLRILA